jgi:hypothetical protein
MNKISVLRSLYVSVTLLAFVYVTDAQSNGGPELHNTGVNASDVVVASGQASAFWTLSAKPAAASQALGSSPFRYKHPSYFADTATAAWVSPGSNGTAGAAGNYVYDLAVDLTGFDAGSVSIAGGFGTDNDGAIWVNNESPVATTGFGGFGSQTAFTIDSGWVAGMNTIHVRVNNGGDPTAFFVQFDSVLAEPPQAEAVPVPLIGPWGMGLLAGLLIFSALFGIRRRYH